MASPAEVAVKLWSSNWKKSKRRKRRRRRSEGGASVVEGVGLESKEEGEDAKLEKKHLAKTKLAVEIRKKQEKLRVGRRSSERGAKETNKERKRGRKAKRCLREEEEEAEAEVFKVNWTQHFCSALN